MAFNFFHLWRSACGEWWRFDLDDNSTAIDALWHFFELIFREPASSVYQLITNFMVSEGIVLIVRLKWIAYQLLFPASDGISMLYIGSSLHTYYIFFHIFKRHRINFDLLTFISRPLQYPIYSHLVFFFNGRGDHLGTIYLHNTTYTSKFISSAGTSFTSCEVKLWITTDCWIFE
jgi:hypothetical protein